MANPGTIKSRHRKADQQCLIHLNARELLQEVSITVHLGFPHQNHPSVADTALSHYEKVLSSDPKDELWLTYDEIMYVYFYHRRIYKISNRLIEL